MKHITNFVWDSSGVHWILKDYDVTDESGNIVSIDVSVIKRTYFMDIQ